MDDTTGAHSEVRPHMAGKTSGNPSPVAHFPTPMMRKVVHGKEMSVSKSSALGELGTGVSPVCRTPRDLSHTRN